MFNTDSSYYSMNYNQPPQLDITTQEDNIVTFNDEVFHIKRIIHKSRFKTKNDIKLYRDYLHVEKVKQYDEYYLFVNDIPVVTFEEL